MASQRDVKNRISSVKNIQKITRAMEMVAAARLRRAEQRITALRPYAEGARANDSPGGARRGHQRVSRIPLMREPGGAAGGGSAEGGRGGGAEGGGSGTVGLPLVTGDRGLRGAALQAIRAGVRLHGELSAVGLRSAWYATGRRGVSSLAFRGYELSGSYTGFSDRPAFADATGAVAGDVIDAYVGGQLDRVELIFNSYVSPLTQVVTRETLLPLSHATAAGEEAAG